MTTINMEFIEVRGFDLFFEDISRYSLLEIAKDLGGDSSFNEVEMSATYMFEKPRYIFAHEISFFHECLKNLGMKYQHQYGHKFKWSEVYLKINENGKNILNNNPKIKVINNQKFG